MKKNIFSVLNIIIGALLIAGPFWLFPVCSKMNPMGFPMKCYYSGQMALGLGIAMVVLSLVAIFIKKKGFSYFISIIFMIAGLFNYLAMRGVIKLGDMPTKHWEVGLCAKPGHPCLEGFSSAMSYLLVAILVVNVAALIYNFVKRDN